MAKGKISFKSVFQKYIWPRKKMLFIGLILIFVSRITGMILPISPKYLVDNIIEPNNMDYLWEFLGVVAAAVVIQAGTSFLLTRILSVEAQSLIAQLRVQVQKKVLSLPISYFDNHKSGELVSRIMTDVEGVRNIIGTGLVQLIGGTLTFIFSLAYMLYLSPKLTAFVIIPMILFGVVTMKAFAIIRPIFRKRGEITAEVTGRLTETLGGIRVIKGFGSEQQENTLFEKGADKLFQNIKSSLTATAAMTSVGLFAVGLTTILVFGVGAWEAIDGNITSGDFMSIPFVIGFMVAPILQMSNIGSQITEGLAGLDRTEEILRQEPENKPEERPNLIQNLQGDIVFDGVSFSYESSKEVVHDISFEAPAGSVTALVGSSGSGKSTIAGLAASFLTPGSGQVLVDGQDLSSIELNSFRSHLGVVLQDEFLFEGTIRENILFPNPEATEEALQHAVEAAYVNEFTDRFEEGLETIIGERGVKLSGGQRQRIAIARALLANPKVIILDEATSNLDTESEALIQKSLNELMKGRTTFVIAHRLSTIRQADQILVIEKGAIIERGNHDALIEKKGRYYELFTYQARL